MDSKMRLATNIRLLRNAFNETQERLGSILDVEKNTISTYECGTRELHIDTIAKIAEHYMISVEELMSSDLSYLSSITYNGEVFGQNIDAFFPIAFSDSAMENPNFKKAYEHHCALYSSFRRNRISRLDRVDICLEEYSAAFEDDKICSESAANILALIYLTQMIRVSSQVIADEPAPAPVVLMMSQDAEIKKAVESTDQYNCDLMTKDIKFAERFNDPDFDELLDILKSKVKQSGAWSDLADFYIASQYLWGLVDNDMDWAFNRRVGFEMLQAFISVGNAYAERFVLLSADATGQSSQYVDDKD